MYVAQARGAKLVRQLWELGIGECTVRGELPPRRHPYLFDNGAYKDWTAGTPFDSEQFLRDLDAIYRSIDRPEFIVLPDIVAGGLASLEFSKKWLHRCLGLAPLYLAVQDGMEPGDLDRRLLGELAGLFVGGTLEWKVKHGAKWVAFAHERFKRCHIGRVGTENRTNWALRIGADSIDSALPLWSEDNMKRFLRCTEPAKQFSLLFAEAA